MAWTEWQNIASKGELLWTKPGMMEYVGGDTIDINVGAYNSILVTFYTNAAYTTGVYERKLVGIWLPVATQQDVYIGDAIGCTRRITINSDYSVNIGKCMTGSTVYNSDYLIPTKIYGFKKEIY